MTKIRENHPQENMHLVPLIITQLIPHPQMILETCW